MIGHFFRSLLFTGLLIVVAAGFGISEASTPVRLSASAAGLAVVIQPDGTYEIRSGSDGHSVIQARVAAEIDHKWVKSTDYPKHDIAQSNFDDALGHGKKITITSSGLSGPRYGITQAKQPRSKASEASRLSEAERSI